MVEIKNKVLYVNGTAITEPYVNFLDNGIYSAVKIFNSSEEYQRAWEAGKFDNFPPDVIKDNFGPILVPPGYYFVMGDNRDRFV